MRDIILFLFLIPGTVIFALGCVVAAILWVIPTVTWLEEILKTKPIKEVSQEVEDALVKGSKK